MTSRSSFGKAVAMGATQLEPPQDRGDGFITAAVVDPFGNILGIMYKPHYLEVLTSSSRREHTSRTTKSRAVVV